MSKLIKTLCLLLSLLLLPWNCSETGNAADAETFNREKKVWLSKSFISRKVSLNFKVSDYKGLAVDVDKLTLETEKKLNEYTKWQHKLVYVISEPSKKQALAELSKMIGTPLKYVTRGGNQLIFESEEYPGYLLKATYALDIRSDRIKDTFYKKIRRNLILENLLMKLNFPVVGLERGSFSKWGIFLQRKVVPDCTNESAQVIKDCAWDIDGDIATWLEENDILLVGGREALDLDRKENFGTDCDGSCVIYDW